MQSNWPKSYALVRKSEGSNDDDPLDHGGRTSRGITQREYSAWRQEHGKPDGDVWKASEADIQTIYHDEYWNPQGDLLPVGIDYLYFDMAVNAGPSRAAKLLQQALGVTADGRIGPVTRQAIRNANARTLIMRFSDAKREFYTSLHQPKFIKGWLNRTNEVQMNAIKMVQ